MGIMARIMGGCGALLLLLGGGPAQGDETVRATLHEKSSADEVLSRPFYLSSGGVNFHPSEEIMLEPLLGLGHDMQHRDLSLLAKESAHSITAQAGGRISILEGMYLSAALKYPLYSFQNSSTVPSGSAAASTGRGGLDILNPTGSNLTWSGEVGTHFGTGFRSFFYYDKVTTPLTGGTAGRTEDRMGIRFQLNFN